MKIRERIRSAVIMLLTAAFIACMLKYGPFIVGTARAFAGGGKDAAAEYVKEADILGMHELHEKDMKQQERSSEIVEKYFPGSQRYIH